MVAQQLNRNKTMKTRRWMQAVLEESKKDQIEMPWARELRAKRREEAALEEFQQAS